MFIKYLASSIIFSFILISSCHESNQPGLFIGKDELFTIVRKNDDKFSVGVRTKDANLLANIYSDSAQYVQPKRAILVGKDSIRKDWENFIALKERPVDLVLHIHEARGNREIIYESGDGYTLLADSSRWSFNYVNVWRLQNDGSYKLEIDTYNDMK
jgi:ketosteroid isomerase-like protein